MSLLEMIEAAQADAPPAFGPRPQAVVLRDERRRLALVEHDGDEVVAGAEALRLACRCAWCTRARIDGLFPERFVAVEITAVEPIGGYALRLHFSDGHDRGIFPWGFIRDIAAASAGAQQMETVDA